MTGVEDHEGTFQSSERGNKCKMGKDMMVWTENNERFSEKSSTSAIVELTEIASLECTWKVVVQT